MQAIYTILSSLGFSEYALIVLAISIFIDINPKCKWNPLKAIFGYIGNCFNRSIEREISGFKKEVNEKFEKLQAEQSAQRASLDKLIAEQENDTISSIRWEIIEFESSIMNGSKHSRDQYRHILDRYRQYKRMVESSDNIDANDNDLSRISEAYEYINNHYETHRHNQSAMMF